MPSTLPQKGINDFASLNPELAKEADGWDPKEVIANSHKIYPWRCNKNHRWSISPNSRNTYKTGCPYCSNRKVWKGFNDLETLNPELAKEADGWDPSQVLAGSAKRMPWICDQKHTWNASINDRTNKNSGCPSCAESGFNPEKPSWFYLMKRFNSEHQLGISNVIERRIKVHELEGWETIEITGPHDGYKVYETEKQLKEWLRKKIGLIEGTHENWYQSRLKVHSLKELKKISGIETDLF